MKEPSLRCSKNGLSSLSTLSLFIYIFGCFRKSLTEEGRTKEGRPTISWVLDWIKGKSKWGTSIHFSLLIYSLTTQCDQTPHPPGAMMDAYQTVAKTYFLYYFITVISPVASTPPEELLMKTPPISCPTLVLSPNSKTFCLQSCFSTYFQ